MIRSLKLFVNLLVDPIGVYVVQELRLFREVNDHRRGSPPLYSVYFFELPRTLSAGYFNAFFSSFDSTAFKRSTLSSCDSSNRYQVISASSSAIDVRLSETTAFKT